MKKINIVLWGIGQHSINKILPAINNCKSLNLYGLFSRNKKVLNKNKKKFDCKTWLNSNQMLKDSNIDVIYLATPIGLHFEQAKKILSFKDLKYYELVHTITYDFVKDTILPQDYLKICKKTYEGFSEDKILSHTKLDDNELILNLFHGPTLAFKDFALQLLGNIYDFFLKKMKTQLTIIGATSGDTGSAAIEGCSKSELIKIFILFPHEKVSEIQRRQMTTFKKKNVFNIAIRGDFDDCQNLVKSLFERNNKKFANTSSDSYFFEHDNSFRVKYGLPKAIGYTHQLRAVILHRNWVSNIQILHSRSIFS